MPYWALKELRQVSHWQAVHAVVYDDARGGAHIAVDAVKGDRSEHLLEDLVHIAALIAAGEAGLYGAVVDQRLAVGLAVGPVGMALVDRKRDLGEIRPGDDLDALFMAAVHEATQVEAVQIRAARVVLQLSRVACDQTRRVEHHGVAGEVLQ